MASFCAKCGSALSSGEQFCPSCGAAAGDAAAVTPAQPAAVPAKFGSSAVKIILVIVAIVVLLGSLVLGAVTYVGYRISRAVHVNSANGQVTMSTPGGTFSANSTSTITASDLGTDIYPGAQSAPGGMKMSLPTGSTVTGVYVTSDSKDQVAAFYQSKFGSDASIIETSDSAILSVKKSPEESVMVTITVNSTEDQGKTRIVILHTKSVKAS